MDIFLKPKNYQTLAHNKLDCLSWYIKDVSFVLAHHLTKLPLPTNDKKAKDRGKHVIYEEMIQTWVTHEVVKVYPELDLTKLLQRLRSTACTANTTKLMMRTTKRI